jgi:hypothetical protein
VSDLRDQLDEIADASPAPTGAVRDREIQQAVTRGLATPAREGRRVWTWVVGASVAAAAVIALVVVGIDRDGRDGDGRGSQIANVHDGGSPVAIADAAGEADRVALVDDALVNDAADPSRDDLVVERGNEAPVGALVEASELTVLRAGAMRVEAKAKTKFQRVTRDASKWRLDEGELAMQVSTAQPEIALEVTTPDARIVVDKARLVGGARFVIGRYASQTVVDVQVGEVLVTPTDGNAVIVHAGERWPAEPPLVVDAGVVEPPKRSVDAGVRVPVLQFDATIIRKTIRAGKVGDAREMIEAGRSAHASSRRAMAELGILAAEADLAERKTKNAIGKYLDVVRDYAATPQAEQALFAAAQIAIDRPDAGYKAEALLKDYIDTYPKGQFAKDAARLLETLKK